MENLTEKDTIVVSDAHLGSKNSQPEKLYHFLEWILDSKIKRLVIAGDLFEFWSTSYKKIGEEEYRVVRKILELSQKGIKVVYVPGNHDRAFRGFQRLTFGKLKIRNEYVIKADGKKFLVVHGDEFDAFTRNNIIISLILDKLYAYLIHLNRFLKIVFRMNKSISFEKYSSRYEKVTKKIKRAALAYAKSKKADGIIIGHTHKPEISEERGITYVNAGDWIEECSYVVVGEEGARLEFWKE